MTCTRVTCTRVKLIPSILRTLGSSGEHVSAHQHEETPQCSFSPCPPIDVMLAIADMLDRSVDTYLIPMVKVLIARLCRIKSSSTDSRELSIPHAVVRSRSAFEAATKACITYQGLPHFSKKQYSPHTHTHTHSTSYRYSH